MGGSGSGRWGNVRTRRTVESAVRLRVSDVRTAIAGLEAAPEAERFDLTLRWPGRLDMSAAVERDARGRLDLALRWSAGGAGQLVRLPLEGLPQRGAARGARWWFACPVCWRRCAALFLAVDRRRWACRVCERLTYASSNRSDKRVSALLARGTRSRPLESMSVSELGVALEAARLQEERMRRALVRDLGERRARRDWPHLFR